MPAVVRFVRLTLVSNNSVYRVEVGSRSIVAPASCRRFFAVSPNPKFAGPSKLRVCDKMPALRVHVLSALWRVLFLYRLEETSIVCFVWVTAIFNRFSVPIRMAGRAARVSAGIVARRARSRPDLGPAGAKEKGPALHHSRPFGWSWAVWAIRADARLKPAATIACIGAEARAVLFSNL